MGGLSLIHIRLIPLCFVPNSHNDPSVRRRIREGLCACVFVARDCDWANKRQPPSLPSPPISNYLSPTAGNLLPAKHVLLIFLSCARGGEKGGGWGPYGQWLTALLCLNLFWCTEPSSNEEPAPYFPAHGKQIKPIPSGGRPVSNPFQIA